MCWHLPRTALRQLCHPTFGIQHIQGLHLTDTPRQGMEEMQASLDCPTNHLHLNKQIKFSCPVTTWQRGHEGVCNGTCMLVLCVTYARYTCSGKKQQFLFSAGDAAYFLFLDDGSIEPHRQQCFIKCISCQECPRYDFFPQKIFSHENRMLKAFQAKRLGTTDLKG